jgi:YbgC/YbaW family acyl-CoA thioester hydrolase
MEKRPVTQYRIRFSDCDPLGHLNNGRYIDYLISAREDHLRDIYQMNLKEYASRGIGFVVSHHEIRYIRPVSYYDLVSVQSALIGIGEATLQVEMLMLDESGTQLKAILWTNFTRINLRTGAKENHPEDFLAWVKDLKVDDVHPEQGMLARIGVLRTARSL